MINARRSDRLVAEQVRYYRARAAEYDATAYGDLAAARARVERLVATMQPSGAILEIACGTGMWTGALAGRATSLHAIDAAPETIALARARVRRPDVSFEVADVFTWTTPDRFDVIFFSAWLSHVPADRFAAFWDSLRAMLSPRGRVLFIDEHVDEKGKESFLTETDETVTRTTTDGTRYRIVKAFVDPEQLTARLLELGWRCRVDRDGHDWVRGEAWPDPGGTAVADGQ